MSYSFFTQKSRSFIRLICNNINEKFDKKNQNFIEITGPIKGKLFFLQPAKDVNVIFTINKEELTKVKSEIIEKLPEQMYFV